MIYLDNAATSFPKPESVYQAVDHFSRYVGANPGRSGYDTAREASRIVAETRQVLAELFRIDEPRQIAFTSNATEALNLGLKGVLRPDDHVITTITDHNSVLRPLRSLADRHQVAVTRVRCDPTGSIALDDISAALRPDTRLVCMTHASNVTGIIHDIGTIGGILHENGTLLMVDAAQTAGSVPIDVRDMQIDLLAFTGHKGLFGPQGTGGLYIKPGLEVQVRPLVEGGTGSQSSSDRQPEKMPDRFEGGTHNTPGLAGLGAGVRFVLETGVEAIQAHESVLTERLLEGLAAIPGVRVYGPSGDANRVAVVSFTLEGWPPLNLAHLLASAFGVATRSGLHCAPLIHRYLGTSDTGTVRASIGYFNTEDDIAALCTAVEQIADQT
ncbi:MAG: aminotransferase class V-fold PLP-dependent enzyme [Chloroflexota bacterium]|nr:aminotransferase class V-fold PLP-dependent enzyme [Chloroflexota bacterium]